VSTTSTFDLGRLKLTSGEGRRYALDVPLEGFEFGGERYEVSPATVPVTLDLSRMTHGGWSLRLRLTAHLAGPCMRCLAGASPEVEVDAREVDKPGGGDELESPYVDASELDLAGWARDALALALPAQIVCREDCAGLCPVCGEDLNANPHEHERGPDPRWAKLGELRLEEG
jgi:uncharacterized protein